MNKSDSNDRYEKKLNHDKKVSKKVSKKSAFEVSNDSKQAISNFFGSKVAVKISSEGKGSLEIPFKSEEDFLRILKLINS